MAVAGFRVQFHGEGGEQEGVDEGGLSNQLFTRSLQELLKSGLLGQSDCGSTWMPVCDSHLEHLPGLQVCSALHPSTCF